MQFTALKLDDRLQRAVVTAGYTETTPIQEAALPAALDGADLIGTAQTGTGKTAAFVLPILQRLLDNPEPKGRTRALIVAPTRELAEQVHAAVRQLSKYTKIRSATVYGGVAMDPQTKALRSGAEIIVACPGRLLDHLGRGNADLRHVEILILDEADRMLDMGFLPSIRQIVERVPKARQTMLFSATFAPELQQLCRDILNQPQRIEMGLSAPANTIAHALCPVAQEHKTACLLRVLEQTETKSVLIFTRTKHRADRVAKQIGQCGYRTTVLHSNRTQGQRQRALDGFRRGEFQLLVATDIAARGLDIETISHVINYDIPDTVDAYIHRIGRTGRAERNGDALTLVTADDRATVRDIERHLGDSIEVRKVEGFDFGPVTLAEGGRGTAPTSWHNSGGGPRRAGSWPLNKGGLRRAANRRAH